MEEPTYEGDSMPVTGVIDCAEVSIEKLLNARDNGVNLTYENWKKENPDAEDEDYEDGGESTVICGFKKNADGLYEPDPEAEVSFIYNGDRNTIQVTQSKWVAKCAWCSPCYPHQGDLGTEGEACEAFTFGPDWFDEEPVCKPTEYQPE